MASPLEIFNQVTKDFELTKEKQLHPRQQQAFAEAQLGEVKAVANRLAVDVAKARMDRLGVKDDVSIASYDKKISEYENELRQFSKTIDFFSQLVEELGGNVKAEPSEDSL